MRKTFIGVQLRRLREERALKQTDLARALGISTSYLNQIEQNHRPLTVPVLLKINAAFGLDVQMFAQDEEARFLAELREVAADAPEPIAMAELRELAGSMPALGRLLIDLHHRYSEARERTEAMGALLGEDWRGDPPARMPFEQVRDFFYARHNYVEPIDEAAERLYHARGFTPLTLHAGLVRWLREDHRIEVVWTQEDDIQRRFEPDTHRLYVSAALTQGQQAFQMATQIGLIELGAMMDGLVDNRILADPEARRLARVGLANYFAGALLLPYGAFLAAAESKAYDIERLGRHFGVGFETVCHRLSTLQRAGARGVPFFFVRVDRAGNISKRQSATDFHFSRVGGNCPLWNVYAAFAQPGRVLTQLARMPDGKTFLWIARSVERASKGYGQPESGFAIGLGCDISHAARLVYSRGINLHDPAAATPIGAGCKLCDRPVCPQRAFPPLGKGLTIDENRSTRAPYAIA